jgi:hypothetical protein
VRDRGAPRRDAEYEQHVGGGRTHLGDFRIGYEDIRRRCGQRYHPARPDLDIDRPLRIGGVRRACRDDEGGGDGQHKESGPAGHVGHQKRYSLPSAVP